MEKNEIVRDDQKAESLSAFSIYFFTLVLLISLYSYPNDQPFYGKLLIVSSINLYFSLCMHFVIFPLINIFYYINQKKLTSLFIKYIKKWKLKL